MLRISPREIAPVSIIALYSLLLLYIVPFRTQDSCCGGGLRPTSQDLLGRVPPGTEHDQSREEQLQGSHRQAHPVVHPAVGGTPTPGRTEEHKAHHPENIFDQFSRQIR